MRNKNLITFVQKIKSWLLALDHINLSLKVTVALFLVYIFEVFERSLYITENYLFLSLTFLILGIIATSIILLKPYLILKFQTWIGLTIFSLLGILLSWPFTSNHGFLIFYLTLAILLSLYKDKNLYEVSLARHARLLIGFSMFFAVVQKLLTPEFLSGDFFYYMSFRDPRFSSIAELLNLKNHSLSVHSEFNSYVQSLIDTQPISNGIVTTTIDDVKLKLLSIAQMYVILTTEILVAILFLIPSSFYISKFRDHFVLLFIIGTYLISIEYLFGFVFLTTSFIQSNSRRSPILKAIFLSTYVVIGIGMTLRVLHYKFL